MKNSKIRRQNRKSYRLSQCHSVVIGAGGLGRQVAILLASLGVRHLSLYDPRIVSEYDMAQGFLDFDVGTPAVDAVANTAHQYHPQMELLTYHARFRRSHLTSWRSGLRHVVFLCSEQAATRKAHWQWVCQTAQFLCLCEVNTETIQIVCSDQPGKRPLASSFADQTGETTDIVTTTLAGTLMVMQFRKWLIRTPCHSAMQFNVPMCELIVQR